MMNTSGHDGQASPLPTSRRHASVETPLGEFLVAADGDAVIGGYFHGQKYEPDAEWFGVRVAARDDALLRAAAEQLTEYFAGKRHEFDLPLEPRGTDFQRRVWSHLLTIPFGYSTTYGGIAEALGSTAGGGLAQGVGQAVGHNPISIIVPCHRVLGSDSSMTGYAGGLKRKQWLLAHENTRMPRAEEPLF